MNKRGGDQQKQRARQVTHDKTLRNSMAGF
jgi:hypothetical protein